MTMPASALEWALTLSILPFYLWYGYATGTRIGYWLMKKLFGGDETMTCSHPWCWVYADMEPVAIPLYMKAHFEAEHPEVAGRLEKPAEALRR